MALTDYGNQNHKTQENGQKSKQNDVSQRFFDIKVERRFIGEIPLSSIIRNQAGKGRTVVEPFGCRVLWGEKSVKNWKNKRFFSVNNKSFMKQN